MTHPQAARTACRYATPLTGATPVAKQSPFHGVPRPVHLMRRRLRTARWSR
jgi:hypothetical protein